MSAGLRSVGPGSAGSGSPCLKLPGEVQGSSRAKPGPVARWRGSRHPTSSCEELCGAAGLCGAADGAGAPQPWARAGGPDPVCEFCRRCQCAVASQRALLALCLPHFDVFIHKLIDGEGSPGWEVAANPLTSEPVLARFV